MEEVIVIVIVIVIAIVIVIVTLSCYRCDLIRKDIVGQIIFSIHRATESTGCLGRNILKSTRW